MRNDKITIYHIEGRRSLRVIWLCEELGLPYELVFKRGDVVGSMATIREVFPYMPLAPTVRVGDAIITESGAILELIQSRFGAGRLAPAVDSADYPYHLQWLHFAEGTAMARMVMMFVASQEGGKPISELPKGYRAGQPPMKIDFARLPTLLSTVAGIPAVFDFMEDHLKRHPYFGGAEFTTADIMMQFGLPGAQYIAGLNATEFPHFAAWVQKVQQRPAFKRAMEAALPDGVDEFGVPKGPVAQSMPKINV